MKQFWRQSTITRNTRINGWMELVGASGKFHFPICILEELSPVDGFDLSVEIPRILGGPILWKMIGNMQEKLQCEQRMNAVLEAHREIEGN